MRKGKQRRYESFSKGKQRMGKNERKQKQTLALKQSDPRNYVDL